MNRIKQVLALCAVCGAAAMTFSAELASADPIDAVTELGDSVSDSEISVPAEDEPSSDSSYDQSVSDDSETVYDGSAEEQSELPSIDTSGYTDKLNELNQKQQEIEQQLADGESIIADESEKQMLLLEKINTLNEKNQVINSYMTELQMSIASERESAEALKKEIDSGVENYKKRLRAMYIAGDLSYTDVLLSSGDFFDVLMRTELVKRVADHDESVLDSLVEKKAEYEKRLEELNAESAEYENRSRELDEQRAELAELYNSSSETKQLYKDEQKKLEEQQLIFENEIYSYEGILDDLLKGTYGNNDDETVRLETEKRAAEALSGLRESINERIAAGEVIPDTECSYTFKWPVAGHYYVSSGVGARWGAYHKGLDIPGESGVPVTAAEAGEVVRTNNSCVHNYGKSGSCGCGGGYGNFVIIDHGNGFLTLYGHLSSASVEVGDKVKEGDVIGLMGSTGFSTGTHTHFELRYDGYVTDPALFVRF